MVELNRKGFHLDVIGLKAALVSASSSCKSWKSVKLPDKAEKAAAERTSKVSKASAELKPALRRLRKTPSKTLRTEVNLV